MRLPHRTIALEPRQCPNCGADDAAPFAAGYDYEYRTCANQISFVACAPCGTVYLDPCPSRADFSVIYPDSYYSFVEAGGRGGAGRAVHAAWAVVERRRARGLEGLLGSGAGAVLDVGCGDGRLLRSLSQTSRGRLRLTGVDVGLPRELIARARARGIELIDSSYEDVDLGRGRFDLIVAQQVIEHVHDPGAVLDKGRRELRPGGYLVLDTPNVEGLDRHLFSKSLWGGYHFPRHLTLFSPSTLSDMARRRGFTVVSVEPLLSPVFWIMTLHNVAAAAGAPQVLTRRLTYRSVPLLAAATAVELPARWLLKRTSNMRVVLRKAPHLWAAPPRG